MTPAAILRAIGATGFALFLLCAGMTPPAKAETAKAGERRVALVIGNSDYEKLPELPNPANDVGEVAKVLRKAGFDVTLGLNTDGVALEEAVRTFLRSADGAYAGLIYYSGHGVQVGGQNFLVPVDASLESAYDVETQTMPLDLIVNHLREKSRIQLIFLDACRNNPFKNKNYWMAEKLEPVGATRGLARVDSNLGSLIAFSTAPGEVALDGAGTLSPYTQFFVEHADIPNKEIRQVLTEVRRDVIDATKGAQVPWENSSLLDAFYFFKAPAPPILAAMQQQAVPAGGASAKLSLAAPQAPTGAPLTVTVEQVPQTGRLLLDGRPVAAKAKLDVAELERLSFDPAGSEAGTLALFGYSASDPYGQSAQSVVAITVVENKAARLAEEAKQKEDAAAALDAYLAELDGTAVDAPIGVGPTALSLPRSGSAVTETAFTVEAAPAEGVLRSGDRALSAGDALTSADLGGLTYEPAVGSQDKPVSLALSAQNRRAQVSLMPRLDPCDAEAGAPLDLQGVVSPGLLPNEIDAERALAACRDAVTTYPDVARFLYQQGRAELAGRDAKTAAATFEKALAAGHVRAGEALASLYQFGALGERDLAKAADYAGKAAERGDPYGLLNYGRALYFGRGVAEDRPRGLEMMIQAAGLGHTYAMNALGDIFLRGEGVAADPDRGIRYFETGVARKDIYSMNNLALAYRFGKGAPEDHQRALLLFKEAADGGQPFAPTSLGRMYRDGIGTEKNEAEAISWLEIGADRGDYWGALERAKLALAKGGLKNQGVAARYLALAAAMQRLRGAGREDKQAVELLRDIPAAAKKSVEKTLRAELTPNEQKAAIANAKTAEERLRDLAAAGWTKRNPRYDLF